MAEPGAGVKRAIADGHDLRGRVGPDRLWLLSMTTSDDARAERLAAALRDNLRRRKGQAREVRAADPPTPPAAITSAPDVP